MKRLISLAILVLASGCNSINVPLGGIAAFNCPGGHAEVAVGGIFQAVACYCGSGGLPLCTTARAPENYCSKPHKMVFVCPADDPESD